MGLDFHPPVTRFVTRTCVGWSGFRLLEWRRARPLSLVGDQWDVSEFSHNPSGRGFEPHPPHIPQLPTGVSVVSATRARSTSTETRAASTEADGTTITVELGDAARLPLDSAVKTGRRPTRAASTELNG
jgi:hypothetical protein